MTKDGISELIFGEREVTNLKGLLRKGHLENKYYSYMRYRQHPDRMPLISFATMCKLRNLTDEDILKTVKSFYQGE